MRLDAFVTREIAHEDFSPDKPFMRSVDDSAPMLRDLFSCPAGSVDEVAFVPLADAVAAPKLLTRNVTVIVVPQFHGGLLGTRGVADAIEVVLSGEKLPKLTAWSIGSEIVRGAAGSWQVPELPLSLNKAWSGAGVPTPRELESGRRCTAIHDAIAPWLR
jgi:hypothetical protein